MYRTDKIAKLWQGLQKMQKLGYCIYNNSWNFFATVCTLVKTKKQKNYRVWGVFPKWFFFSYHQSTTLPPPLSYLPFPYLNVGRCKNITGGSGFSFRRVEAAEFFSLFIQGWMNTKYWLKKTLVFFFIFFFIIIY